MRVLLSDECLDQQLTVMTLLGMMAAAQVVVTLGLLHIRPLQILFNRLKLDSVQHKHHLVTVPPGVTYWNSPSRFRGHCDPSCSNLHRRVTVGLGRHSQIVRCQCSSYEHHHINVLEMDAVVQVLKHLYTQLQDHHGVIHTDSRTVVAVIIRAACAH